MADVQVVKYKSGKTTFVVLTKPGTALKFRKGLIGSIDNVLMTDDVFLDYKKGEKPSADQLSAAFEQKSIKEICQFVVEKGEVEISAAERKEAVEKKRAEIVNYLFKFYSDPKTNRPHPVLRYENALDETKFRVDPDLPADKQAQEAAKKIMVILPLKKGIMSGTISLPHAHLGSGDSTLRKHAKVLSENYTDTGCDFIVEFAPGDYQTLLLELGKVTDGDYNFVVEGGQPNEPVAAPSNAKGKKGAAKAAGKRK